MEHGIRCMSIQTGQWGISDLTSSHGCASVGAPPCATGPYLARMMLLLKWRADIGHGRQPRLLRLSVQGVSQKPDDQVIRCHSSAERGQQLLSQVKVLPGAQPPEDRQGRLQLLPCGLRLSRRRERLPIDLQKTGFRIRIGQGSGKGQTLVQRLKGLVPASLPNSHQHLDPQIPTRQRRSPTSRARRTACPARSLACAVSPNSRQAHARLGSTHAVTSSSSRPGRSSNGSRRA